MKNNHVELFGTLTRDIEVSRNGKGNTFVKFSLACLRDFVLLEIFVQALMKKMVKSSIQPMLL